MAVFESIKIQSAQVKITNGVAGAIVNRFVTWQTTTPGKDELITHVPGANGAPARGILAEVPNVNAVPNPGTGFVTVGYVRPDGSEMIVELGEAVTQGAPLRIGGNSTEVDGAAYLADATGDVIVGYALEAGGVGAVIRFEFTGFSGTFA